MHFALWLTSSTHTSAGCFAYLWNNEGSVSLGWREGAEGVCQLTAVNTQLFVDSPTGGKHAWIDALCSYLKLM